MMRSLSEPIRSLFRQSAFQVSVRVALAGVVAMGVSAQAVPSHAQTGPISEAQVILPETEFSVEQPQLRAVFEMMGLYEILGVMSSEGIESAAEMEADMFPGQGGTAWPAVVAALYSADTLIADFEAAVPRAVITDTFLAEIEAFFQSDLGQTIAAGELTARRAFLEPGVEDAAREMATRAVEEEDARIEILTEFITANELVERNVTGALNASFAFYRGLADGEAFETEIPEDLMLAEVWGQEPEIRQSTTEWLYAYQMLAYSDLSEEDLQEYVAFSMTPAGQALNTVLFTAFDVMFERVSYDLGKAAAVFIAGEET